VDGQIGELASLIRWDELTRNADLIPAKHVFFVMDACYGGLALTRRPFPPGSMRFLKDMLQRYSRQVLTAGKADEVVADAGGPRPGHSIFTGHALDALEGAAATADGIITASGVMAYVYERVARDPHSRQTPHYGFLDGDGDFVFHAPPLQALGDGGETDTDVLVKLSPYTAPAPPVGESVADTMKELLPTPMQQIRLDDYVSAHVRRFLDGTRAEQFPVQGVPVSNDEFVARLKRYEDVAADLETIVVLLGRWAERHQLPLLEKVYARIVESDKGSAGNGLWLSLGWYPGLLLMYEGGIAALAARNYDALAVILRSHVRADRHSGGDTVPVILPVIDAMNEIGDAFKRLPGYERNYVPRSEYLFKRLQPPLEDLLFLGRSYESLFDRFEILFALCYADADNRPWGPPGRFAWKHSRGLGSNPYRALLVEAGEQRDEWPPVKAGLFNRSSARFLEIANAYKETLDKLHWW